jgi:Skp family chaperone for outer membrane proteins
VKRSFAILAGIVVAVGASTSGNKISAQQPAAPAAPAPTSKIAVVNLQKVIKDYVKFKNMQAEMKAKADGYRQTMEAFATQIKNKQTQADQPTTSSEMKERLIKEIKDLQRQGQDKGEEFQANLQKAQFEQLVATYKDISAAVEAFARARGIEMVMQYQDGVGPEMYLPAFFTRRMSNGACQPLYTAPGVDITESVIQMLNSRMTSTAPPAGTPRPQ